MLRASPRDIDHRLIGMIFPIEGIRLPRHAGVYPGARRLYRYGVHQGMDFFYDPGNKVKISTGTPVRAAAQGKITRVDSNFKDMDAIIFARVMNECRRSHRTSDHNEDLLRGCQVWLDHGNGFATRYAHLERVNPALKPQSFIAQGSLVGFVGVSGTGQNLPGKVRYPHLHFEIWLDGHYLGWGLTPAETIDLYENIFNDQF